MKQIKCSQGKGMGIFNNFLCKVFAVMTVLFCSTGFNRAFADIFGAIQICEEGYYLSSCSGINVGTNWLKGIKGEGTDFYSYGIPASDRIHMDNLRKFFVGLEPIEYTDINGQKQTVLPTQYTQIISRILSKFCVVKENQNILYTECKKCPNDAKVPASVIKTQFGQITTDGFKIHTIADCYMDEFSDNTGTYVYIPSAATNGDQVTKCYYSNNVEGDELVSE